MKKFFLCALTVLLSSGAAYAGEEAATSAETLFTRLKAMEGTWKSESPEGVGEHLFRTSANGSVVMETMHPGTEHEMINMYHLDGNDLVLTHYCAGGNQPTMKLGESKGGSYDFDFTGGTNFDPAVDPHIHEARLEFEEDGTVLSTWIGRNAGEEAGTMVFTLSRGE